MTTKKFDLSDPVQYQKNNPFMDYCHIEIVSVSPECSKVRVEMTHELKNLNGTAHGGLLCTLADCVAGITARADGRNYVTQSAHINFIRNVTEGTLYAVGTPIKRGRHTVVIHVQILHASGTLLADASIDMFCLE
ncbi:MAG: PaaI family thioesterase [Butyricicoccus sp.]|nr:PaaI family thioesterase [Butyricicoccus sp.]